MIDKRFPGPNDIHRQVLANGITILAYENFAIPTIVVDGVIRAGALQDGAQESGTAALTAEMLLRGTATQSFAQIFESLESVGAGLYFGSGRHVTQFSGHCLREDADLLLGLLSDALRSPTFPEQQVSRLKSQVQTRLQMRASDTRRMAALKFMETLYHDHPYGRSVQGYPESIENLNSEKLSKFYSSSYGPAGMIISIVGAITTEEAIRKVSTLFRDWTNQRQTHVTGISDKSRPKEKILVKHNMPGKIQTDLLLGLPGPRRSAPDYLHASLMNTVLGVFGMMGRIGQVVREDLGLAYYASTHLDGGLGPAPWTAEAGTGPEKVFQVISAIEDEIARIQNQKVSTTELEDSKSFRIGSMPVGLETNSALANTFVDMELYELELDYLQRFPHLIRRIVLTVMSQKIISCN